MTIDLDKVIELFGMKGLIISIIIMVIGGLFKTTWFNSLFTKITDGIVEFFIKKKAKSSVVQIEESDIINHDIFNYIDFWMYSRVGSIEFSTEYRTVVFRKYLTIYLRGYKTTLSNFIKSGEYKTMNKSEMRKAFLDLINRIVWAYEKEMSESGIPEIIISKMKNKNNESIQLTIDLIGNISNSQFYESSENYLKLYSILNIILSILENTISNSEDVCNSINGQLKGLRFNDGNREVIEP